MKKIVFILIAFISCSVFADEVYTNNITGDCGNTYSYSAVFDVMSFNCAYGYFLPAGATSCVACPNGYTCSGGTYEFNANITQGLDIGDVLVQNAVGSCSNDFPQSYHAIYEPDTITLNWDDGNGNVTTGTCSYDSDIELPEPPTRVGYTFTGWKVKTSE